MKLLFDLLQLFGVSGEETPTSDFLINYIQRRKRSWKVVPSIYHGEEFHDCILLKFGNPRTALFAHMDTIGFMSRYENQLISVGGPEIIDGTKLVGRDSMGDIRCTLKGDEEHFFHDFARGIDRGTRLAFEQNIRIDSDFIQAAYLDNRLGLYAALEVCENLTDGWVVFTTYEEHGGGSMPFLLKFIQENAPVHHALIADITWITEGVLPHEGVVISIRDKFIPRKKIMDRIINLAEKSGIPYQLEVEAYGGSDGREVQFSPYAIDWCFVGAAEENVHTPDEKVSLRDLHAMVEMHKYLMKNL
ncbi:M20/M25/M40 family metallo-hydrolase [Algoriphagus sp. CAU 1675]|uniref:M20/M25/M40 family metallo-hydrolase n=1 Tax=Algoriphagus sp. CAU 1675 TaxID=3032597 RepID=UPI0023DCEA45|nr:M20/M25/M40 family metallo-hydrolase [Algoriphagus sp. CAU 1675]MDF2158965.1 M20/M25/M40 family metallo-hydrolase [Algoriphagus sp. CAU 1675]